MQIHRGGYVLAERWSEASPSARHCLRLLCVQVAAPDAVGVGASAAVAWGWPVALIPPLPTVAREPSMGGQLSGCQVRRVSVDVEDVAHRHGLTLTSPVRTAVDIAARADLVDALITVDAALRGGVASDDALQVARMLPLNRGRQMAIEAIQQGDPASESALESISRGRMLQVGLPLPLANVVLRVGNRWYRVDFLWAELGVVGECDGKGKYDDPALAPGVIWREKRRHEQIEEWGFRIARWGYPEVATDPGRMQHRISQAIDIQTRLSFSWPPGVRASVPVVRGVATPERVVAEVKRLQRLGYPIGFASADTGWARYPYPA